MIRCKQAVLAAAAACLCLSATTLAQAGQPNVILIVADDLGYSDLGAFGGEIDTPNLDALVRDSRMLKAMYVAPTCSPTRSMLFSGTDNHLAGVGNMAEMMTPTLTPDQVGKPGYEGYLTDRVAPLPQLLRDAGYHTYMAGKWHLGAADGLRPESRGFEQSFALMGGGAAHFNQSAPQQMHAYAPPPAYRENGVKTTLPQDFYSSTFFTDKLINYIEANRQDGKPFFAYAAYTAPHLPLQAPDKYLQKYRGRYDAGYEAISRQRVERMKKLGVIARDVQPAPMPPGTKPWKALSANERAYSARNMEAYAATVDALDDNIGRLVVYLKKNGLYDNTVIMFLSDNGPEGNDWSQDTVNDVWIPKNFDTRLENVGRSNSFAYQGPAWGQVSAQPFRFYKAYTHEGGVRSPAFIHFPAKVKPGQSDEVVTAMDVMPTILDLAGARHPGVAYQGHTVLPMKGMSLMPYLQQQTPMVHSPDYALGLELMGRGAVRKGDWKIVYSYQGKQGGWALYNVKNDPGERHDLAKRQPAKLKELLTEWAQYVQQNNVVVSGKDISYPRRNY